MSFYIMAFMGTAPLGNLLAGAIADRFSPSLALIIGGTACIAAAAFSRSLPALRRQVVPIYQRSGILPEIASAVATTAELTTPPEEAA